MNIYVLEEKHYSIEYPECIQCETLVSQVFFENKPWPDTFKTFLDIDDPKERSRAISDLDRYGEYSTEEDEDGNHTVFSLYEAKVIKC